MFGINGGEALVLLLVAVIVIGPERLPGYAEQLGTWVRRLRVFMQEAKTRVDEELGVDTSDVDWQALDPRRYDPRRIVREALLDDLSAPLVPPVSSRAATPSATARTYTSGGVVSAAAAADTATADPAVPVAPASAPYDDEAT